MGETGTGMNRQSYLTFDCYGTLIDWKAGVAEGLIHSFGRFPIGGGDLLEAYIELEAEEERQYTSYRSVLEGTSAKLAARFGLDVSEGPAKFAASLPSWPAFPDTAESLKALGEKGYRRYILSNVDEDLLKGTLRESSLEVDGYVTAEEVRSYKPAPGHWNAFLKKTGASKEEDLHVAQSLYHDIIPAQGMGFETAWINRYRQQLPRKASPLYICDGLSDLVKLLE